MNTKRDQTSKLKKDSSKQTLRDYLAGKARLKKAKSEDRFLLKAEFEEPQKNPLKIFRMKVDEFLNYLRKNVNREEVLRSSQKLIEQIIDLFEKTVTNAKLQGNTTNEVPETSFLRLSEKEIIDKSANTLRFMHSLNEEKLQGFQSQKAFQTKKIISKEDIDSPMVQSSPGKTRIKRFQNQVDSAKQLSPVLENIMGIENYQLQKKKLQKKKSGLKMPPRVSKRMSKFEDV